MLFPAQPHARPTRPRHFRWHWRAGVGGIWIALLVGAAVAQASTVTLTASKNPVVPGSADKLTASVAGTSPTGTVQFVATDFLGNPTVLCAAAVVTNSGSSGTAECATSALPVGDYSVVAHYSGDGDDSAASSAALAFWVASACRNGATPGLAMPTVTWLRSYHAGFRTPSRLAADAADNVLVADEGAGEVVVRAASGAVIRRLAGIERPVSVAAGGGRHYVGDAGTGSVTVYDAGWQPEFLLGGGAGEFGHPGDIAYDAAAGEVFVSDTDRHVVGVYAAGTGELLRTLGRFGRADGQFHTPTGIAVAGGELLVADQMNYRLEALDKATGAFLYCLGSYSQSGFFTGSGGPGRTYGTTQGLQVDGLGRLYVVDAFQGVVRLFDRSNGALIGSIGSFGQGAGQLRVPTDLVIDANNRLFVASVDNARLEVWGLGSHSDPEAVTFATVGLAPDSLDRNALPAVASVILALPGHAPGGAGSLTVNGLVPLTSTPGDADDDGQADLRLDLDPAALIATLGAAASGPVTVAGVVDGLAFSAQATLSVTAAPVATGVNLSAVPNPAQAGDPVTLTASVDGLTPTGSVNFRNGAATLCASVPLAGGQADCAVPFLAGFHSLVAEYGGDVDDAGSVSPPYDLLVDPRLPGIALASSDAQSDLGQSVTFTATLTGVAPGGLVNFMNGAEPLCLGVELVAAGAGVGTATCVVDGLTADTHAITASYLGDASNSPTDGGPFSQTVDPLFIVSGASPAGGGNITVVNAGSCGFASYAFLSAQQAGVVPPAGVTLPHGLFDFTTTATCTPGETITLTITYPAPLPPGTQYWKFGPTPTEATPHWYVMPASILGNVVNFSITDGGLGDDDLVANGRIVDLGGPGASGLAAIPASGPTALVLLAISLVLLAGVAVGRRRRAGSRLTEEGR